APGAENLVVYDAVGLVVVGPTLRMAHDDRAGTAIRDHFRRHVASKSTGRLGVTVLGADSDPASLGDLGKGRKQGRRREPDEADPAGQRWVAANDILAGRGWAPAAVHFPVPADQGTPRGHDHLPKLAIRAVTRPAGSAKGLPSPDRRGNGPHIFSKV